MPAEGDLLIRIKAACDRHTTSRILREEVLHLLRRRIDFDAHVFALTDPVTRIGTSPHASVPLPWPRLPELIRSRYLTPSNRHDTLPANVATSLSTSTGQPDTVWRRLLHEIGVTDSASVTFTDRYGAWGFLELWRTTSTFTEDELRFLSEAAPSITSGLRASQARTFAETPGLDVPIGPAVVILDGDVQVRNQTEGAAQALLRLLPPNEPIPPIPAVAYNVAAALIAQEENVAIGPPWSRVHLSGSDWVTARASRLGNDIAVSIEPSTPEERRDLIARSHGLSERETEALSLAAEGLDTKSIAARLFVSEHTANDHVKAVLTKTGTHTRQLLLARIIGAR